MCYEGNIYNTNFFWVLHKGMQAHAPQVQIPTHLSLPAALSRGPGPQHYKKRNTSTVTWAGANRNITQATMWATCKFKFSSSHTKK